MPDRPPCECESARRVPYQAVPECRPDQSCFYSTAKQWLQIVGTKKKGDANSVTILSYLVNEPDSACHATRQESFQLPRPHRMLQLANRFGLHLPHALAGDFEDSA